MVKIHIIRQHTAYLLDGRALTKVGLMFHLRHRGIPPKFIKMIHKRCEGHSGRQQNEATLYKPSEYEEWILLFPPP